MPDFKGVFLDLYTKFKPGMVITIEDFRVMEITEKDKPSFGIGISMDCNSIRIYKISTSCENIMNSNRFIKLFTIRILRSKGLYPKLIFKFH